MGNVIKLEIDTDDSYTTEEKEDLLESFLEFIQDKDPSVVEGTESIRIVSSDEVSNGDVSDEKKREIISEFLEGAQVEFQVQARFRDEDGKTVGNSVSSTGFLS